MSVRALDCHYISGNFEALRRVTLLKRVLKAFASNQKDFVSNGFQRLKATNSQPLLRKWWKKSRQLALTH